MTWLRLDDNFAEHPKIARLSDSAFRAHVLGMCYCARHLTDGFVPVRKAQEIAADCLNELTDKPRRGTALWIRNDGEYEIHDYLEYNPSRADVLAEREQTRKRQAEWREKNRNAVSNGVTDTVSTPCPVPGPYPLTLNPKEKDLSP